MDKMTDEEYKEALKSAWEYWGLLTNRSQI